MDGIDIDAALRDFGGAVARFRAIAHGTRRPARSRWRKWCLCLSRIRREERWQDHLDVMAWALGASGEARYRRISLSIRAWERYRRMLWGGRPFGKGQR